jgi:hypothetical protein
MTNIYNYHLTTGEYLSQAEANLDPLEGKPLLPSFATTKKPPALHEHEMAVFKDDAWNIVSDYRGTKYWLADGTAHVIESLDKKPPKKALESPPPPSLDELKAQAKEKVSVFATNTRAKLTGHADYYKVAGWNKKGQLAERIANKTATDAEKAIVKAECTQRGKGETPLQLARKQLARGQRFAMAIATIDGMESASLSALATCTTVDEIKTLLTQLDQQAKAVLAELTQ